MNHSYILATTRLEVRFTWAARAGKEDHDLATFRHQSCKILFPHLWCIPLSLRISPHGIRQPGRRESAACRMRWFPANVPQADKSVAATLIILVVLVVLNSSASSTSSIISTGSVLVVLVV